MANGPDFHIKLIIGDLVGQLACARADNEALREELAAARAQLPTPEPAPRKPWVVKDVPCDTSKAPTDVA